MRKKDKYLCSRDQPWLLAILIFTFACIRFKSSLMSPSFELKLHELFVNLCLALRKTLQSFTSRQTQGKTVIGEESNGRSSLVINNFAFIDRLSERSLDLLEFLMDG